MLVAQGELPLDRHALVLDDSPVLRKVLRRSLSAEGWNVLSCARNEAAVHLSLLRRPDLVLLDISEPEYAPEAVATGLRIHYGPDLPILAMAAAPQPELMRRIGACGFVPKPLNVQRLVRIMERAQDLADRSTRLRAHSEVALDQIRHLRLLRP
ncbi:MAG TPA: response regulator [Chloroflexota bacterium]|nr:response regulator [Chloroflexota bacterium]